MLTALLWAQGMSKGPPALPKSLSSVQKRAEFVEAINKVPSIQLAFLPYEAQEEFRQMILESSKKFIIEEMDDATRIATGLRLWSGCIDGAKTLAGKTRDGGNTREMRIRGSQQIGQLSLVDSIYKAGAETAPVWKRLINQGHDLFWDGVPDNSPLVRYKSVNSETTTKTA